MSVERERVGEDGKGQRRVSYVDLLILEARKSREVLDRILVVMERVSELGESGEIGCA